jgi:REP element-mobilizing transposase RayT
MDGLYSIKAVDKILRDVYLEMEKLVMTPGLLGRYASSQDHIHMLVSIPPKMSVSKVVGVLKANTSRRLEEKFSFLKDVYWGTDGIWSDGYFVSPVGNKFSNISRHHRS